MIAFTAGGAVALVPIEGCGSPLEVLMGPESRSLRGLLCQPVAEDRMQVVVPLLAMGGLSLTLWVAGLFHRGSKRAAEEDDTYE